MKKTLLTTFISLILALGLGSVLGTSALAAARDFSGGVCTGHYSGLSASYKASYCSVYGSTGTYANAYCYPNGSYWQTQISEYPAYYSQNNSYYVAEYGC